MRSLILVRITENEMIRVILEDLGVKSSVASQVSLIVWPKFYFLSHGCHLRFQPSIFLVTQNKCRLSYPNKDFFWMEEGNIKKR